MKYKVWDKVKVKSIEWYNANKDKNGYVHCQGTLYFIPQMLDFCGKIVTIDGKKYKIKSGTSALWE